MISIITPCYNRANLISNMITSVLNQTYTDWELLIIDDGSTDNTKYIIDKYLDDKRINYIKKTNTGAADSRNVGVKHASKEFITFLDSDDVVKPEWLETIKKFINNKNFGYGSIGFQNNNGDEILNIETPKNLGPLFCNQIGSLVAGSFVINKNCFEAVNGYDTYLESGQHTELLMRVIPYCMKNNLSISFSSEILLQINHHKGNRIRTNHSAIFNGTLRILEKHFSTFLKSPKDLSNYYAILGYQCLKLNNMNEMRQYYWKSFKVDPSFENVARFLKYSIKN
jgi:glycosyltransferase involved in cell wall biosynthesis